MPFTCTQPAIPTVQQDDGADGPMAFVEIEIKQPHALVQLKS